MGGDDSNKGSEGGDGSNDEESKGETMVVKGRMHSGCRQGQGRCNSRGDKDEQEGVSNRW